MTPDIGRPFYRAVTTLDALALIEEPPSGAEGGSNFEAAIVEHAGPPVYLRIAPRAKHLRELGMSDKAIARALCVSDKTVAKAIGRSAH